MSPTIRKREREREMANNKETNKEIKNTPKL